MSLAWSAYGDPLGAPVLYFHGTPGSRMEARMLAPEARRNGLRVLAVDRPGLGYSDPDPEHTIVGWPRLVADFADQFGLDRFGLVGWSGGGPYALACVAALPERVTGVALLAPAGVRPAGAVRRWGATLALPVLARGAKVPGLGVASVTLARMTHRVPVLGGQVPSPGVVRLLVDSRRHALHPGHRGWLKDLHAIRADWDATLRAAGAAVTARAAAGRPLPATVWHGSWDRTVPIAEGREVADALGATLVEDPDANHVTVFVRRADEVCAFLAAAASGA